MLSRAFEGVLSIVLLAACGAGADDPAIDVAPPARTIHPAPEALPAPASCSSVTRGARAVRSLTVGAETPPPLGGMIVAGTYDLTELLFFDPTQPPNDEETVPPVRPLVGGASAQITIAVETDHMRFAEGTGDELPPNVEQSTPWFRTEKIFAGWYHVDNDVLAFDELCPTRRSLRIPYTASNRTLVLYTSAHRAEVFTRR